MTAVRTHETSLLTVGEFAERQEVSASTVRRWIREGVVKAAKSPTGYVIGQDDNWQFILSRLRQRMGRPQEPWVPDDLATYSDWHSVLDELVWLIKVTYSTRDALRKRRFRLDHLFQSHLDQNVGSLGTVRRCFASASPAPPDAVAEDLRRAWYNELAFAIPLRSSTLGLGFRDVELNKPDAATRLSFPSWRIIKAYYAVYFYVRCLSLMKTSGFRVEQHASTLNTFKHSVLPSCDGTVWPWPLNIRHVPGRRVSRASLPIQALPYLGFQYARHPRTPHRTPLDSYEYVRAAMRKRARARGPATHYTLVDFLYDFRVWANYLDVDGLIALWGPGYRSFIDMNLSVLLFFIGGSVELAFAATQGEEAYAGQLQRLYGRFIERDADLTRQFTGTPLFQRLQIYRGKGLVTADLRLRTEPNPHQVEML